MRVRVSEVCVTLYSMCFQKTTGGETILKRYKLNDGEWFLSRHWTVQTQRAAQLEHGVRFISPKPRRINVDATNERVVPRLAFCVFDLQINWPQFRLMRFAPRTLTRFQSQALIVGIGFSACGALGGYRAYFLPLSDTWP